MTAFLPKEDRTLSSTEPSFSLARRWSQREGAYRLVYESYLRRGLDTSHLCPLRVTPYHLLDSTQIFVGESVGQVVSTVTMVKDGERGLPMEVIYPREIAALRARGITMAEASCLADRSKDPRRFLGDFCQLMRLMAQFARRQGTDQLLVAVHPRHARFYTRYLGFQKFGGLTSCNYVLNRPAVALSLSFARIDRDRPACYLQFFGELIPEHMLEPYTISRHEKEYLESLLATNWHSAKGHHAAAG